MLKLVRIKYPFIEQPNVFKERPAILLTKPFGQYNLVVVAFITSQLTEILPTDVWIKRTHLEFAKTGLAKDSLIKIHKLSSIEPKHILGIIGELPEDLELEFKQKFKIVFANCI